MASVGIVVSVGGFVLVGRVPSVTVDVGNTALVVLQALCTMKTTNKIQIIAEPVKANICLLGLAARLII
jgi:hypothetical protein